MIERKIDLGYLTVAAKCWGDPSARPVLALHGWLDNAASFDSLAPLLEDCYVVVVDMPGHGQSDYLPEGVNYHLTDAVANTLRLLDALQWERATLMGHSMGASIATLLAGSFPARVERLILLDAIGPLSEKIAKGPERLGRAVTKLLAAGKKQRTVYPDLATMAKSRSKNDRITLEAAHLLAMRGAQAVEGGYSWCFDRRLLLPSMTYFNEEQVAVFLSAIEAAVFLLTAKDGLMADNSLIDQRIAEVSNIVHTTMDGHHHVHMDRSDFVAKLINQFLAEEK